MHEMPKQMMRTFILYPVFVLILLFSEVFAQKSDFFFVGDKTYQEGYDLFQKQLYAAAQQKFKAVIEQTADYHQEIRANASYYNALCAQALFNQDAEPLFLDFIKVYPEHPEIHTIYFELGNNYFRRKDYAQMLVFYKKIEPKKLAPLKKDEYYFNLAYAQLQEGDKKSAENNFYQVVQSSEDSDYKNYATYYYAHLLYQDKRYQNALEMFQKLQEDKDFEKIIPYHILQIYAQQKKYKELLDYAEKNKSSLKQTRNPKVYVILADAALQSKDYKKADAHFFEYEANQSKLSRTEYYQWGFVQYQLQNYDKSLKLLAKTTEEKDSLGQLAYYYMGDCYLKQKKYHAAAESFYQVYQIPLQNKYAENALLNRAKIISQNPQLGYVDDLENTLQQFIQKYPNSSNVQEAYTLLAYFYSNSGNLAQAKFALEQIPNKNPKLLSALQLVCYNYGTELYQKQDFRGAISQFKSAIKNPVDKKTTALSAYWVASAYYQTQRLDSSAYFYEQFKQSPSAFGTDKFNQANYDLGYVYYNQAKYREAMEAFVRFVKDLKAGANPLILSDAYLRLGDCYYAQSDVERALQAYENALQGKKDRDYALLQKAILLGERNQDEQKEQILLGILREFPRTEQKPEVLFQLAEVSRALNKKDIAQQYYKQLIAEYPYHTKIVKAKLELALIYYKDGKASLAAEEIKKIIENYNLGKERDACLTVLEEIYVDMGKTSELKTWMDRRGLKYRGAQIDTLAYQAAQKQYIAKNYSKSIDMFDKYLRDYPNPSQKSAALFLSADALLKTQDTAKALQKLEGVLREEKGEYYAYANTLLGDVYLKQKNWNKAVPYLKQELTFSQDPVRKEFLLRQFMEKEFADKNYKEAEQYASQVLAMIEQNGSSTEDVLLVLAKSKLAQNKTQDALEPLFQLTAFKNRSGAEAQYLQAEIYLSQKQIDKAEEKVDALLKRKPAYKYWNAKGFLLMSDILLAKSDTLQAKLTLESILQGYKAENAQDDVIASAKKRYQKITEPKNIRKEKEESPVEEMELNFNPEEAEKLRKLYN